MWIKFFRLRPIAITLASILVLVAISTIVFLSDETEPTVSMGQLQELLSRPAPESVHLAPDLEMSMLERF